MRQSPQRRYFLYDRRLLFELSRCIWETLKIYFLAVGPLFFSFSPAKGNFQALNPIFLRKTPLVLLPWNQFIFLNLTSK